MKIMNTFETIMENGAFAQKEQMLSIFHNIFKCMSFQRWQKALLQSKGLMRMHKSFPSTPLVNYPAGRYKA